MTRYQWRSDAPLSLKQTEDHFTVLGELDKALRLDRVVVSSAEVYIDGVLWYTQDRPEVYGTGRLADFLRKGAS